MKKLLSLIFLFVLATSAQATTYGPTGETCHTDGTLLTAGNWETTLEAATPGTKYRLPAGTLTPSGNTITITAGTSDAARVTVVPDNCATVTISGRVILRGWTTLGGLIVSVPSIATAGAGTVQTTGQGNIVRNSDIRTVAGGTNNANVLVGGGSRDTLVQGNIIDAKGRQNGVHVSNTNIAGSTVPAQDTIIRGNKMWVSTGQEDAISFSSAGAGGNTRWQGTGNLIEDNWFTGGATENYVDLKGAATAGSLITVRNNYFDGTGVPSGCVLVHTDTATNSQVIIERNYFVDCNQNRSLTLGGKYAGGQLNEANWSAIVRHNVFVQAANTNEAILDQFASTTIERNVFISGQIQLEDDIPNKQTTLRDNILSATDIDDNSGANDVACDRNDFFNTTGGLNSTCANNVALDPQFVGGTDYNSQQAGLVDVGTNVTPFNGTRRDIGALEHFTATNAEIGNVADNIIVLNLGISLNTPVQITNSTGWSTTCGTISSVATGGDAQLRFTLTGDYGGGGNCAITYNADTGNTTDSAGIGGPELDLNGRMDSITSFAVTDNTGGGGGGSHVFTQTHFRFHQLTGTEASPTALRPEDNNITVPRGAAFRIRIKIACTIADCPAENFKLRYSLNGGAYTEIPDTAGADDISMYGTGGESAIPAEGTETASEHLTNDQPTNVSMIVVRTNSAIPNWDCSQNCEGEAEHVVKFTTSATLTDQYCFRLYHQDGTALDAYNQTGCMTVGDYVASGGF